MKQSKRLIHLTVFTMITILFTCGWSRTGAFLAGCLTASLFYSAVHSAHHNHHSRTTVVYEKRTVYKRTYRYQCGHCNHGYRIYYGVRRHTCPRCHTVYVIQR